MRGSVSTASTTSASSSNACYSLFERRQAGLRMQQPGRRNRHQLSVDTMFVIAHTDFLVNCSGALPIRRGDIIRVQRGGDEDAKCWYGTVVKSYHGSEGSGYFFPVLTEPYGFMDNRIAARIPMALFDAHGNFLRGGAKRRR
ncbi:hypothetical protein IWQ56_000562 [Coemansia nantahalensis]|uniref:Uncharacterized protein n=1 Tax=Coemansia nantahalensis TaxID=2789366 RepID=A0ACC1K8E7_9FUNG|nr:hypothetical protein IWQ56_000562 [Coemansia nantahalensis]KAJ2775690.1 hypothetical protein IWQ57_000260 [Coemansia nantahalensis]